jgi:hypothetical protein
LKEIFSQISLPVTNPVCSSSTKEGSRGERQEAIIAATSL